MLASTALARSSPASPLMATICASRTGRMASRSSWSLLSLRISFRISCCWAHIWSIISALRPLTSRIFRNCTASSSSPGTPGPARRTMNATPGAGQVVGDDQEGPVTEARLVPVLRAGAADQHDPREPPGAGREGQRPGERVAGGDHDLDLLLRVGEGRPRLLGPPHHLRRAV